jgi:hypothetical protein
VSELSSTSRKQCTEKCVCGVCVYRTRKRPTVENVRQVDRCELVTADCWMSIVDLSAPTH